MSFKVINTQAYLTDEARKYLEDNDCRIEFVDLGKLDDASFSAALEGVHGVIAGGEWWTDKTLGAGASDSLKSVARTGTGVDHIDLEAASKHGIQVTNTPGATSHAVADLTIGLFLCLLRDIPGVIMNMKKGIWEQSRGRELGSMTVGVVGAGAIGKEVIKRARGFGSPILAYDVLEDSDFAKEYQVKYVPLEELVSNSDIVSLHCPLMKETEGLISKKLISLMKKDAYLANFSRAQIVDREALIRALSSGAIAGAAIDVHDPAPCDPDDALVMLDNVLPTPWMAYSTRECIARMCMGAARDLVAVLRGEKTAYPVNKI